MLLSAGHCARWFSTAAHVIARPGTDSNIPLVSSDSPPGLVPRGSDVRAGLGEGLPPGPFNELALRKGFVDMRSEEPYNPHGHSLTCRGRRGRAMPRQLTTDSKGKKSNCKWN
jgi:hypothetical protein